MKHLHALIIICLVAAIAAVLILPQVDLSDAVLNSARLQISTLAHSTSGSLFAGKMLPNLASQMGASHGSRMVRESDEGRSTNAHSVLTQIHILRC